MKTSSIVKIGIGISATCAALLSVDNMRQSKKARELERELELSKAETEAVKAEASAALDKAARAQVADLDNFKYQSASSGSTVDPDDAVELKELELYGKLLDFYSRAVDVADKKISDKAAKAEAKAAEEAANDINNK